VTPKPALLNCKAKYSVGQSLEAKTEMQPDPDRKASDREGGKHEPPSLNSKIGETGNHQETPNQSNQNTEEQPRSTKHESLSGFGWIRRWWGSWRFDREPSIFDAITTVVSVIGLTFLIAQWKQTDRALQEAKEANSLTRVAQEREKAESIEQDKKDARLMKATEDTAAAARDSAGAAKSMATTSRQQVAAAAKANETAQISQRAFLNFQANEEDNGREFSEVTKRAIVMIIGTGWSNSGATPAVDGKALIRYVSRPDPPMTGSLPRHPQVRFHTFAVAPHEFAGMPVEVPMDVITSIVNPPNRLFIYGWATYRDSLPNTPIRLTEFCQQVVGVRSVVKGSIQNVYDIFDSRAVVTVQMQDTDRCYDEACPDYAERAKAHSDNTGK
jgi:hypothetical protein